MTRRISILVLMLFFGPISLARAEDAPDTLEFKDLIGHPERWPAAITITENIRTKIGTIPKGTKLPIIDVVEKGVLVDAKGHSVGVPTAGCDIVTVANEAWSKLTPAQRALDAKTIQADASLWPETVKLRRAVTITGPFNLKKTLPPGTVCTLATYDEQGVYLLPKDFEEHVNVKFAGTDFLDQARALAAIEPAKRKSRIVEGIRDVMVDSSGKPTKLSTLDDTKIFVFYIGANWCAPCHDFSPLFVKWYEDNSPSNPHLTVVMLNDDPKDEEMLAYMKKDKMTFPAIRIGDWKAIPVLKALNRDAFPQCLIMDHWGKVLYHEVGGGPGDIKLHMEGLKKMIDSGAAK